MICWLIEKLTQLLDLSRRMLWCGGKILNDKLSNSRCNMTISCSSLKEVCSIYAWLLAFIGLWEHLKSQPWKNFYWSNLLHGAAECWLCGLTWWLLCLSLHDSSLVIERVMLSSVNCLSVSYFCSSMVRLNIVVVAS